MWKACTAPSSPSAIRTRRQPAAAAAVSPCSPCPGRPPCDDGGMSFAFVEAPLDRAEHLRSNPSALVALWPRARLLVLDPDGQALAGSDDALLALEGRQVAPAPPDAT